MFALPFWYYSHSIDTPTGARQMFKIKIQGTNRFVRDPITTKPHVFETFEHAQKWADDLHRDSVLSATAWNSTRRTFFVVVPA